MGKYLFHTLFRLPKEGIVTSFKSIAFFLLLSTQVLFGLEDVTASTSTMKVYNDGTKELVCYTGVPGVDPSDKYAIRVKSAATGDVWVPVFTHKTYNRQQELSYSGDIYSVPPVGPLGDKVKDGVPDVSNTWVRKYLFHTGAWSHSYANIEMSPNMPVQVEITAVNGFQIQNANFDRAAVYPPQKAAMVPGLVVDGKVIFELSNPAQIVIDINGNMDDSNKVMDGGDGNDIRHTVSLFANPIMVKPSLNDTANVVAIEPTLLGAPRPSDDLGTKTTMYFKPGVHNLGVNFKLRPGKKYYIPGDAIVYGTFNNSGMGAGNDIKLYGYGTISGERITTPQFVTGANGDEYKSVFIPDGTNAEINGICITDPANHAATLAGWNTKISWAKAITWRANGDGFGPVDLEEDCFLRTTDDSGYIKGNKSRNTYWKDGAAGLFHMAVIPTNTAILIKDCDLIYSRSRSINGFPVFDQRGSGFPGQQFVDVTVRNFRLHDQRANRPFFSLGSGPFGSSYSGIKFENISIASNNSMSQISGRADAPWFGGLSFKNVTFGSVLLTRANFANYFFTNEFANYFLFDDPRSLTLATAADASQGFVARSRDEATYLEMTNVILTAVAKPGSVFSHWSGGASGTTNPLTVWMTDNKTITAHFAPANFVDPMVVDRPFSGTFIVPEGVSSITLQAWGGGGAGGSAYGGDASYASNRARAGGGAGGSYAVKEVRVVQPGDVITYSAGAGGSGALSFTNNSTGASGGVSFVKINGADVVSAVGGPGGKNISVENADVNGGGGIAPQSGNIGDRMFYGGSGSAGSGTSSAFSGPGSGSGGGSAGATGNGGNAPSPTTAGSAGSGGGAVGGRGVNNTGPGLPGGPPGAGGSGAIVRDSWYSIGRGGQGSDGKIIFSFNTIRYTLTPTAVNGAITTDPSTGPFISGRYVTVTANANLGFAFTNWSGDLTGSVNPTTITMDGNKSVTANFSSVPTYTLTTSGANGLVALNPPGGIYNQGTVVTVTATPDNGYAFANWGGDLTGASSSTTITMTGNRAVTANFLQNVELTALTGWVSGTSNPKVSGNNRLMTVMVMGESSGDFSATSVTYGGQTMTKRSEKLFFVSGNRSYAALFTLGEAGVNAATSGTIAVTWSTSPSVGSAVYSVLLAGVDQANPVSAVANQALSGTSISTTPLVVGSGDMVIMCGATENNTDITYNNGFTEQFEANASWGDATGGSKLGVGANETPSFTQSATGRMVLCAMVVKRAVPTFSLATSASNGAVTLNPPGGIYNQGTVVTVTAAPNSGSTFSNWSGDLTGSVNPTNVTMNGNRSVTANFTLPTYTLTTAGINGTVTLNPPGGIYTQGTVVTVTAAPDTGFAFSNWSGGLTGSVNPTSVTMNGNLNVTANFTLPAYTLTTAGFNGTVTLNPPGGIYNQGTVVTVMAAPNSGFTFSNWSGGLTGSVNPTSVTMSANRSVIANFAVVGSKTWDGGGANSNWSTVDNWSDNLAPSGPTAIPYTFAGNTQNTSNNDLSGLVASDFNFTNTGNVGNTSPFVLSGNLITLGAGRSVVTSTVTTVPTITDIINLDLRQIGTTIFNTGSFHNLTINGNISETAASAITKNGAGILTLSGNNTYTGATFLQAGTISLSSIADGGSGSNIGSGNSIRIGNLGDTATLNYTGSGSTTVRTVQIGNGASTGGAIILATGANGGTGLKFTAPTFNTQDPDGATNARALTLSGSNTDANTISGIIQNAKTSGVLNLVKDGNGKWILSGVNTYTGNTSVSGGTLQFSGTGKLGGGNYAGAIDIASGATFQYGGTSGGQTLSGVVGTGGGNLSKAGVGGDLILSNGANAYGALNISGTGRVFINNTGALPTAATVALTGGSLHFAAAGTYNSAITVSSGTGIAARQATILSNVTLPGSGSVIFNNDDSATVGLTITNNQVLSGTLSIQVGGGNATVGTATLSGNISGAGGAITKIGTGTLALTGNNTYTGTISVSAGRLILGNNTAGNNGIISDSSNIIVGGGFPGNTAVLQFNRADNTIYAGNITGFASGLAFVDSTGNGNLTLSGNLGTSAIYFKKFTNSGNGAVNLTGTNYLSDGDFFGTDKSAINVTGGTTTKANGAFIGNNNTGTMSAMNISSSGQFIVAANSIIRVGAGGYDGTVTNGASELTITGNALFDTATTTGIFQLGSSKAGNTVGTGTINLDGGTLSTNRSISGGSVANSIFNFNGGTFKATGTTTTISLNAALGRVNVRNGGAKIDTNGNNISIAQALLHSNISGDLATDGGLTKIGTGTLTLSGANTYSGATTISAGTLKLGVNNCLPDTAVAFAAASLDVGTFSDTAGTLDVTAAATINVGSGGILAFAASAGVDWTGGTLNVTGTFAPGASIRFGTSVAGLTATQLGLISINGTPGASLDPSGYLIAASDPYLTWSGGVPFDGDANNDGVQDGLAWLLGAATSSVSARGLLPTIVQSGGSLQMTFSMRNPASRGASAVQLQHSSGLGTSDPWTSVLVPNTSGGPTSGVTFVITPGSPLNGVQATISSSESAGGKLFGRLKGVK